MKNLQNQFNQAFQLHQNGKFQDAIDLYLRVLPRQQKNGQLLHLIGTAYIQTGQVDKGIEHLRRSIAINPKNPLAHNNLGNGLKKLNRPGEALFSYNQAIAIKPDYAEAHNNRGTVLHDLNRLDEALTSYNKAIVLKPDYAEAYYNRGLTLKTLNRLDETLTNYNQAIVLKPDYVAAHNNGAAILQGLNRLDEAMTSYDQAIAIKPDYAEAHWNRSLLLILAGKYQEGWAEFEWRIQTDELSKSYYAFPSPKFSWRGQESIEGKRILVHSEQGFGDVIQFCRYLPKIREMSAQIIFEAPKALVTLLSTLDCNMSVIAQGDPLPEFDAYCPVMSLPYVFKTTLESIPAETPYLLPDKGKVAQWQKNLGQRTIPRVGLAWSGSINHKNDANRSIPLEKLLPLFNLPVELHSLQKEYRQDDLDLLNDHPEIQQHQDHLQDFSDTAALVECMDLVISVDTSIAHVAGAIGKPVWILLPYAPDYRWMLDREDSPWYPSAKLLRQPGPDDWQSVIQSVQTALSQEAGI